MHVMTLALVFDQQIINKLMSFISSYQYEYAAKPYREREFTSEDEAWHKLFFSGGDKFYLVMIDGFIVYKCNAQCSKNVN